MALTIIITTFEFHLSRSGYSFQILDDLFIIKREEMDGILNKCRKNELTKLLMILESKFENYVLTTKCVQNYEPFPPIFP